MFCHHTRELKKKWNFALKLDKLLISRLILFIYCSQHYFQNGGLDTSYADMQPMMLSVIVSNSSNMRQSSFLNYSNMLAYSLEYLYENVHLFGNAQDHKSSR